MHGNINKNLLNNGMCKVNKLIILIIAFVISGCSIYEDRHPIETFEVCDLNFENIAWKGYRIKNKDFEIKIDYEIAEKYKKLFILKKTGKEYNCDGVLYD